MRKSRALNVIFTIAIFLSFGLLAFFVYKESYLRLIESFKDLWNSLKFFAKSLFSLDIDAEPTVLKYSEIIKWQKVIPEEAGNFFIKCKIYFNLFATKINFEFYNSKIGIFIGRFAKSLVILIPLAILFWQFIKLIYGRCNIKHNKDTLPLRLYKIITRITVIPIRNFLRQYIRFFKGNSNLTTATVIIWLLNFNLITVAVEFFAYYFYFIITYEFASLYTQVGKLLIDLQAIFLHVPLWIILIFVIRWLHARRVAIAKSHLRHMEARNCGFINELSIVNMACGSMGKKKTTIITDMSLSQEVMFRQKAFELLQANDMKFPNFPWIAFEDELRRCIEYRQVYNLATIKDWVDLKRRRYEKHRRSKLQLYGYDAARYGLFFDDGLKHLYLFDVLSTYAQLYFVYIIESSLIVANYSIRTDNILIDNGNFPVWCYDFFPEMTRGESRHAHIIDYDALRLGKKFIEDNPKIGSFEFGVLVMSEIGKERGNNLELREVKKSKDEANQKNDLFNSWLKMCRHSATIDNYPFIKVFCDEQRPESWGADARDLCDILNIAKCGERRIALPFYIYEEMFVEMYCRWFMGIYTDFRIRRGDNTLFVYILKAIATILFRYNARNYNKYGYSAVFIEKERGTMDGKIEKKRYYLMNKKIYSQRFSTDCFSDYFNDMGRKTYLGIDDYYEYRTERATIEELKMQNSYFINSLYSNTGSSNE